MHIKLIGSALLHEAVCFNDENWNLSVEMVKLTQPSVGHDVLPAKYTGEEKQHSI